MDTNNPSPEQVPKSATPSAITPKGKLMQEACDRCGEAPVYQPLHLCENCWPVTRNQHA